LEIEVKEKNKLIEENERNEIYLPLYNHKEKISERSTEIDIFENEYKDTFVLEQKLQEKNELIEYLQEKLTKDFFLKISNSGISRLNFLHFKNYLEKKANRF
jgi:hypothetical protein